MERRVKWEKGKEKLKSSHTGDKLHSIICKKGSSYQMENKNECVTKVQWQAQGQRNGKGQCPIVRASRTRLTKQGNKSKAKEKQGNI